VDDSGSPVRESVEFGRIAAFTDGVFAIAITLLVLSLDVPPDVSGSKLNDFLLDSWPQLFAYFLSFAVIGRFWISHHRVFATLHDFDRRLLVLNLAYLALVVLIPFPTELLGDYGREVDAVVLYAAVVGTAVLFSWLILRHALGAGLVRPGARADARMQSAGILWSATVFYASIPVAFASPLVGQLMWLALLLTPHRARPGRPRRRPAPRLRSAARPPGR
jgi:uncharacterized membrane protein